MIEGLKVTTTQLPPMRALPLSKKLVRLCAPILAAGGNLTNLDVDTLATALDGLSDDDTSKLARQLLSGTTVIRDGQNHSLLDDTQINGAFAGMFVAMLKVMWFAIEVNFFPPGTAERLAAMAAAVPTAVNQSTSAT